MALVYGAAAGLAAIARALAAEATNSVRHRVRQAGRAARRADQHNRSSDSGRRPRCHMGKPEAIRSLEIKIRLEDFTPDPLIIADL